MIPNITPSCCFSVRGFPISGAFFFSESVAFFGRLCYNFNIDMKDVTELRRALVDWDVTINEKAADVNKDGSLDLKDLVILRRYLAGGWNIEL